MIEGKAIMVRFDDGPVRVEAYLTESGLWNLAASFPGSSRFSPIQLTTADVHTDANALLDRLREPVARLIEADNALHDAAYLARR